MGPDRRAYCNKCGKSYMKDPHKPAALCDRCSKEAEKLAVMPMPESHEPIYQLIEARELHRSGGRYLAQLRSILNIGLGPLPESKWREEVGDHNFEEAVAHGVLVVAEDAPFDIAHDPHTPPPGEELEKEGQVIKENPPAMPGKTGTLKVDEIICFKSEGGNSVFTARVTNGQFSGLIRLERNGYRTSVTTDNLDLLDEAACQNLQAFSDNLQSQMPQEVTGQDAGPLPYTVRSICSGME